MKGSSVIERQVHPFYQAVFVGLLIFTAALAKYIVTSNELESDKLGFWVNSSSLMLFFIIINCVFSLSSVDRMKYYSHSVISFIVLMGFSVIVCQYFSGIALEDAKSFKWLHLVLAVIFVVFLTIVNLMSKIIEIAKKQDKKLRNEQ